MSREIVTLSPLEKVADIERCLQDTAANPIMYSPEDMAFMVKAFRVMAKFSIVQDGEFNRAMGKEEPK
jgi:hypothetical protein